MPKNVPPELEEKFRRCKEAVMAKGESEDAAYGICYMSVVEGKSLEDATLQFHLDNWAKEGRRNSAKDQERIQRIHDLAVENGAVCPRRPEVIELPLGKADTLVYFGSEVKALGDGRVGGYLVRFSTADDPDISINRDFFTPETDFGELKQADVYYQHGLDPVIGQRVIGKGDLKTDDVGVWIEAQLSMRDEYERAIYELAKSGKLGWSSGTLPHLVKREPVGNANRVVKWPIGLDASMTPTPAEPRNGVVPLKSLYAQMRTPEGAGDASVSAQGAEKATRDEAIQKAGGIEMEKEELERLVKDAAEQAVKAFATTVQPTNTGGYVSVTKDEADQPFESAGSFFKAVKIAALSHRVDPRLRALEAKAAGMSEGVPDDGGYLIPPQYAAGIMERTYNLGQILSRISQDPVTGNTMTYNAIDETSRTDGSRWGGVRGYWLPEAGSLTASQPTFRQVELKLKKVGALCYATDELLEDVAALEGWLTRVVPDELRFKIEDAVYEGDGVGKPLGIMSSPALVSVTRIDANKIQYADLMAMWSRRYAGYSDYVWLINQDVNPQLDSLYLTSSLQVPPNFITYSPAGVMQIKGRPVLEVEYASTLGTTGDIMLASLSQYQSITKGGVKAASSIHVQFATEQTAFRFTHRFDGQPLWSSPLTPFKGTNTQSPFVVLTSAS